MPRKASPTSSRYYFTNDTEQAIVEYNQCDDITQRNLIFKNRIQHPLNKLAENLIHRFKFYNFDIPYEDVKHETVAHMIEKLNKYSPDKGKAFSYFSIVAKNYLINENNTNYYATKNKEDVLVIDEDREVVNEVSRLNKIEDEMEFMNLFVDYVEQHMKSFVMEVVNKKNNKISIVNLFETNLDCLIADSVLELFRKRKQIEVFNKKALYILVKERSGTDKTQEVTKIFKRIEILYRDTYINWCKTGFITTKYLKSYNYK